MRITGYRCEEGRILKSQTTGNPKKPEKNSHSCYLTNEVEQLGKDLENRRQVMAEYDQLLEMLAEDLPILLEKEGELVEKTYE